MLRFLFPYTNYPAVVDVVLVVIRMLFGGLLLWHGMTKIINFESLVMSFPNPIGLGHRLSLYLVIFAEVFCSVGVIFGAFYRLALIPIIISMGIAFFVVHHGQPFASKELALVFMIMFVLMFVLGAGRYSLDNIIAALSHSKNAAIENQVNVVAEDK